MREIMECYMKSVFFNLKDFKSILMHSSLEYIYKPSFTRSQNIKRFSMVKNNNKNVPP